MDRGAHVIRYASGTTPLNTDRKWTILCKWLTALGGEPKSKDTKTILLKKIDAKLSGS